MPSFISEANDLPLQARGEYSGIEYLLVADKASLVLEPDEDTGLIGITAVGALVLTDEFKRVDPTKDSASLIDTGTGARATGTNTRIPVALFNYEGHENEVRKLSAALAKTNSFVVAVYWEGNAKAAGARVGMTLTSEVDTSGQAPDDFSGATFTLTGSEPKKMYTVEDAVLETLQAAP
jgi:hypothetical protein